MTPPTISGRTGDRIPRMEDFCLHGKHFEELGYTYKSRQHPWILHGSRHWKSRKSYFNRLHRTVYSVFSVKFTEKDRRSCMKNFVITVARGFGSGGRAIAVKLADELNIHSYDNRILTLASQFCGYPEHYLKRPTRTLNGSLITKQLQALPKTPFTDR